MARRGAAGTEDRRCGMTQITSEWLTRLAEWAAKFEEEHGELPPIGDYAYAKWKGEQMAMGLCVCPVITGGHVIHAAGCPLGTAMASLKAQR